MNDTEKTRFRSFAERYVIERASSFKEDTEQNDAWKAILQAKTVYKMIHGIANTLTMDDEASQQAQSKRKGNYQHLIRTLWRAHNHSTL